jgi:hypothetical protein
MLLLWRQYLLPTKEVFFDGGMEGIYTQLLSPTYCTMMNIDENVNLTAVIYFAICQGVKMSMKKNVSLCEYIEDKMPVI